MKKRKNYFLISLPMGLFLFIFLSCKDDPLNVHPTKDYSDILKSLAEDVILKTYTELNTSAEKLHTSLKELKTDKTQANLDKAKEAWVEARSPWEKSEGFLFGPVDTKGLDPALDSWPVNQADLQQALEDQKVLSKAYIESQEGTLKGFHTIEYLLWGLNSAKKVEDFTSKEHDYLIYTSEVLRDDTKKLFDAWTSSGDNFVSEIVNAGKNGKKYTSQKSALEELAKGIVNIADEVGNGKINDPIVGNGGSGDQTLEESRFSHNSKKDFADNIKSVQNIYIGNNNNGLTQFVLSLEKNDIDKEIKEKITDAIKSIESIPGTFTDAIPFGSPTRKNVVEAQKKVRALQQTLESKLIPLI